MVFIDEFIFRIFLFIFFFHFRYGYITNTKINFVIIIKKRAEACVDALQTLNPMVKVGADSGKLDEKDQEYFLISARVKGGNSGCPVITNRGYVVGVFVQVLAGQNLTPDIMGYGVAVPFKTLDHFINMCLTTPNGEVEEKPFKVTEEGFISTLTT